MAIPIVLLPGIMGSRLYFPNSRKFWDPDSYTRMARWTPIWPFRSDDDNRVQLHSREPAGVVFDTAQVTAAERDDGWSTVVWEAYGSFLKFLRDQSGVSRVFAVGYDWRQDIGELGRYAAEKIDLIRNITGAERVAVVTHSMGGLVTRAALLARPDLAGQLAAVIHICQPSAGAVLLYRRLQTGLTRPFDGGGGLGDRIFRLLLGNTRRGFLGNMSGLPGAMQLLPSRHFPRDHEGLAWHPGLDFFPHEALYPDAASPPGLLPNYLGLAPEVIADLRQRIADIDEFHMMLGDPSHNLHPESWLIYGADRQTETRIEFSPSGVVPKTSTLGDNTVPAISATSLKLSAQRMIRVSNVPHADACANEEVQAEVKNILANYL